MLQASVPVVEVLHDESPQTSGIKIPCLARSDCLGDIGFIERPRTRLSTERERVAESPRLRYGQSIMGDHWGMGAFW
jgi:hypothetical protein